MAWKKLVARIGITNRGTAMRKSITCVINATEVSGKPIPTTPLMRPPEKNARKQIVKIITSKIVKFL